MPQLWLGTSNSSMMEPSPPDYTDDSKLTQQNMLPDYLVRLSEARLNDKSVMIWFYLWRIEHAQVVNNFYIKFPSTPAVAAPGTHLKKKIPMQYMT
jgi:hypothetical protein